MKYFCRSSVVSGTLDNYIYTVCPESINFSLTIIAKVKC